MKQDQLLLKLNNVKEQLRQLHEILKEENKDGKQMDYVSHPRIANKVDELTQVVNQIEKITYQK
jgi:hypothetical protein